MLIAFSMADDMVNTDDVELIIKYSVRRRKNFGRLNEAYAGWWLRTRQRVSRLGAIFQGFHHVGFFYALSWPATHLFNGD